MPVRYTDEQIAALLQERKVLPASFRDTSPQRRMKCSDEWNTTVTGEDGNVFELRVRQSRLQAQDFSVILLLCPTGSSSSFRLRRHNGRGHEHTNPIERERFDGFHVHMATARYQEMGSREDSYAQPTTRYTDVWEALDCMLTDAGFEVEQGAQLRLLEGDAP